MIFYEATPSILYKTYILYNNIIIAISLKIYNKKKTWIQVTSATLFEKEGLTANKFTLLLIVNTQNKRGDRNGLSAVNP